MNSIDRYAVFYCCHVLRDKFRYHFPTLPNYNRSHSESSHIANIQHLGTDGERKIANYCTFNLIPSLETKINFV